METSSFLSDFIDRRWETYQSELANCRAEFSETAVHDLRVSTRRLLATLELIRALDSHPRVKKMRRSLKSQLDGFDNLRDVQVMLVDISGKLESLPELEPFRQHLLKREKRLLRAAKKHVNAIRA